MNTSFKKKKKTCLKFLYIVISHLYGNKFIYEAQFQLAS